MRNNKYIKTSIIAKGKTIFFLLLFIILNTMIFIFYFANKLGTVVLEAAERELNEITTMIVINNITKEKLSYISVEDMIIVNKNKNDQITDIDFKLDVAYEMLIKLREDLDKAVLAVKRGKLPNNTTVINDNLIIKVPFYAYTNNPFLMNLGPKIPIKINMLEVIRGEITTTVTDYGINTILVNLYLKLYINQSIILPIGRETTKMDFEILIASRIIQGQVPNYLPGLLESQSGIINLE